MKKHYSLNLISLSTLLATVLFCFSLPSASAQSSDAGITSIIEPSGSPICTGFSNVSAIVHNYGTDSLISVTLEWSVNGVAQTSVLLSDTILSGNEDTVVLGSYQFIGATTNSITAYTSNPNGIADTVNANDTASISGLNVRLSGTYTVGGASPDFARISNVVTALNTYGICGPVTFNIRPMTDTIKVSINAITGASATNTILIQSENGDSTSVVFTQVSANMGINDYLIRLNSADYITLSRLTLQRTGTNNLQHVIDFTSGATNNIVTHCRIFGGNPFGTGTQGALIFSSNQAPVNDSMNTFTDNLFEGGSYGIYMNGATATVTEALTTINDNRFVNQVSRGIHLNFQRDPVVQRNRVFSVTTNLGYSGIYIFRTVGNIQVLRNEVVTNHGHGLYLNICTATALTPGLIINNILSAGDTAGVRMVTCNFINLLNNSVLISGNGYSSLLVSGTGSGNIIENNILVNSGGGPAYNVFNMATSGILISDYNNLFTTGINVGTYLGVGRALISDWIAATGQDNNSVSLNPQFVSPVDLHATSAAMDNLGLSLGYVPDDIDGDLRSATTPDLGADEYSPGLHDISITALIEPADSLCAGTVVPVSVIFSNIGTVAAGGFLVVTNVSGAVVTTLTQVRLQTILPGESDTLTYLGTLNTSGGGDVFFQVYTTYPFDENHANDTLYASRYYIPKPTAPVVTDAGICGPGSVMLTAAAADTLLWYDAFINGNQVATGTTFNTPVLSTTTTYFVSAKGVCESDRTPVTASVFSIPVVDLGNDSIVTDSIVLDAGSGYASYLWSTSDTTRTLTVLASNNYSVTVVDSNGCSATDSVNITIVTGIHTLSLADEVLLYPNPATEQFTLEIKGLQAQRMKLRILDMLGAVHKEEIMIATGTDWIQTVSVSSLAKGVYVLQISSDSGVHNTRFSVE